MATWLRNPSGPVIVHSDQGSQYSSHCWQAFLQAHSLRASMSQSGNCHQRRGRELLPATEAQTHHAKDLHRQGRSGTRCVQLHRTFPQPETPLWLCKRRFSSRVRKAVLQPAKEGLLKPGRFTEVALSHEFWTLRRFGFEVARAFPAFLRMQLAKTVATGERGSTFGSPLRWVSLKLGHGN